MGDQSFRVNSVPSLRRQLADSLRRAIVEGFFKPGERLLERELLEVIGGSRSSLREALRQVETEGLVKVSTKGVFVASASAEEAEHLREVLGALDDLLLARLRKNACEGKRRAIGELSRACETALARGEEAAAAKLADELWSLMMKVSGSEPLGEALLAAERRLALHRTPEAAGARRLERVRNLAASIGLTPALRSSAWPATDGAARRNGAATGSERAKHALM